MERKLGANKQSYNKLQTLHAWDCLSINIWFFSPLFYNKRKCLWERERCRMYHIFLPLGPPCLNVITRNASMWWNNTQANKNSHFLERWWWRRVMNISDISAKGCENDWDWRMKNFKGINFGNLNFHNFNQIMKFHLKHMQWVMMMIKFDMKMPWSNFLLCF